MPNNDKISTKTLDIFKKVFRFGIKPKAENPVDKIEFYKILKGDTKSGSKDVAIKEMFPDDVKALFQYWISNCHDNEGSWDTMEDVYNDMDMLYFNCAPISKAMRIVSDEVIQADSNNQKIFIEAKPKIKKAIEELFDKINMDSLLSPTVDDIIQYGNGGWILGFDNEGVSEVIQINPRHLKERLEFSPFELNAKMKGNDKFLSNYSNSVTRIDDLIDMILNKENAVSYYKTFLIGFQVEDSVLPPWKFIHFRNTTNKSPFKPMGVPLYIHALAPYRQYDAAMGLQITARGARFPKSVYKLKLPPGGSPTEKFEKASELMSLLQNIGFGNSKKELPGIGDIIVTIDELYDFSMETPDIELGSTDDLEILRDEILDSTLLPRKLIDPRDGGFGESGVSYREEFKPFARMVYKFQSILLENISQVVKIHLIHSGNFTLDEIDFILSMPYPESQINEDIISSQSALLGLANEIIDALQDRLIDGEKLPPELIKSIYHKFLPYDSDSIDVWVKETLKAKADDNDLEDGFEELRENWKLLEKTVGKKSLQEMVDDIVYEKMFKGLRQEGTYKNRHYILSKKVHNDIDILKFDKDYKKKIARLTEEEIKDEERNSIYEEYKLITDDQVEREKKKKKAKKSK